MAYRTEILPLEHLGEFFHLGLPHRPLQSWIFVKKKSCEKPCPSWMVNIAALSSLMPTGLFHKVTFRWHPFLMNCILLVTFVSHELRPPGF